jgi:hypothetical protein
MAELTKKEEIAARVAAGVFASGHVIGDDYNNGVPDFRQIASDSLMMAEAILEEAKRRQES